MTSIYKNRDKYNKKTLFFKRESYIELSFFNKKMMVVVVGVMQEPWPHKDEVRQNNRVLHQEWIILKVILSKWA